MSSDTYPKQAKLFRAWAKAMLEGATVGKPQYTTGSARSSNKRTRRPVVTGRRRRRFHKKKKKD